MMQMQLSNGIYMIKLDPTEGTALYEVFLLLLSWHTHTRGLMSRFG